MAAEPVHLISRWPLRDGMNHELEEALAALVDRVREDEPDTLSYTVFVAAYSLDPPSASHGRVPDDVQQTVTFEETYASADAFRVHLEGDAFNEFRRAQIGHFYEDPDTPGWPAAATYFLSEVASTRTD